MSAKKTASRINKKGMSQSGNMGLHKAGCAKIKGGGKTPDKRGVESAGSAPKKIGL